MKLDILSPARLKRLDKNGYRVKQLSENYVFVRKYPKRKEFPKTFVDLCKQYIPIYDLVKVDKEAEE